MNKLLKLFVMLFVAAAFGSVLVGGCLYGGYNRAVAMDEGVKKAWAEVDNQLQRRFDVIPNLVETVKGFAGQEKDIFLGVAKSRESYFQAKSSGSTADQAKAAGEFQSALSRLMFLQEKYPDLRSNENFLKLQDSIEGTENRLGQARRNYNDAVERLNLSTRTLLGRLYSGWAGVKEASYFNVPEEAKVVPKVDFTGTRGG